MVCFHSNTSWSALDDHVVFASIFPNSILRISSWKFVWRFRRVKLIDSKVLSFFAGGGPAYAHMLTCSFRENPADISAIKSKSEIWKKKTEPLWSCRPKRCESPLNQRQESEKIRWEIQILCPSSCHFHFVLRILCTSYNELGNGKDIDRFDMPQGIFTPRISVIRCAFFFGLSYRFRIGTFLCVTGFTRHGFSRRNQLAFRPNI